MNIKLHGLWSGMLAISCAMTACSTTAPTNPLDDYEQLKPTTIFQQPTATSQQYPAAMVDHGRYLVSLLGCGTCHTEGALVGEPNSNKLLAGSHTGIAYSNPLQVKNPGVVYPANLTPDKETGIGNWTEQQIVAMIRTGTDNHGSASLPVMPWPAYAIISNDDARAIAAYLLSLSPVHNDVPRNVKPGERATHPFVHFGVYRSIK